MQEITKLLYQQPIQLLHQQPKQQGHRKEGAGEEKTTAAFIIVTYSNLAADAVDGQSTYEE